MTNIGRRYYKKNEVPSDEIVEKSIRTYDYINKRWIDVKIYITRTEELCLSALINNIETSYICKNVWFPYELFRKKIVKSLRILGYTNTNKIIRGKQIRSKDVKGYIDELLVYKYYFTKGGHYESMEILSKNKKE